VGMRFPFPARVAFRQEHKCADLFYACLVPGAITLIKAEWGFEQWQVEMVVSSLNAFAIPGAFIAGYTSDAFGRTRTLAAASLFFVVGMSIMTFSGGFYSLLFGRMICGLGLGCGISIDPLYIAEISPPGALSTPFQPHSNPISTPFEPI